MRSITILLLGIISITVNAQRMEMINQTVANLFIATDNQEWRKVEAMFAEQVELDYSSMNGNPAVSLSPKQITDSWKTILPGFSHTHHQLGNFVTGLKGNVAEVFCYGTATHYLEDEGGNIWTVVGSYDFKLQLTGEDWNITHMKFNLKYQDGNTTLPGKAMEKLKQ